MAWVNNYKPLVPSTVNYDKLLDPSVPWDFNFFYPVKVLQNDRVRLHPFVPALFATDLLELIRPNPELFAYIPLGPWKDINDLLEFMQHTGSEKPDWVFFAVLDLTKQETQPKPWGEGKLAGLIALLNTDPANLWTEIGCVIIGKQFQRTHITSNAVGLLLQWCFEDLGLRRVQWQANFRNEPSIATAKKIGFKYEGLIRWQRVLPKEKLEGETVERNGKEEARGRHTATLGLTWDDWEGGVREEVAARMARTA